MNILLKITLAAPLASLLACSCPRPAPASDAESACISSPLPVGLVSGRNGDDARSAQQYTRRPVCLAAAGTVTRA